MPPPDVPDYPPSDEPDDPFARTTADIDQVIAGSGEVARMAKGIYDAFCAEGFEDSQALYLTAVQLQADPGTAP